MTTKTYITDILTSMLFFCLLGPAFGNFFLMVSDSPRDPFKAFIFIVPFAYILGILPAFIAGVLNGVFIGIAGRNGNKIDLSYSIFIGAVIGCISMVLYQLFVFGELNLEEGTLELVGSGTFAAAICAGIVNQRLG